MISSFGGCLANQHPEIRQGRFTPGVFPIRVCYSAKNNRTSTLPGGSDLHSQPGQSVPEPLGDLSHELVSQRFICVTYLQNLPAFDFDQFPVLAADRSGGQLVRGQDCRS